MFKTRLALFAIVVVLSVSSCNLLDKMVQPPVRLMKVSVGVPSSADKIEVPSVSKLSEVGAFIKKADSWEIKPILMEQKEGKIQFAISVEGKIWEFRGKCNHDQIRLYIVQGEPSINNEPEWKLTPPASFDLVFGVDGRSPKVTLFCADNNWFYLQDQG